ncbi:uracil-DNA glycosylase family protein [uncultured Enterovirga sp.]|uniref:uracil-DNA glycosylase family protein n=1 Tax=uncultured Enterovirga sp. TaxID=2026352 RepID=UPI0035C95DC9
MPDVLLSDPDEVVRRRALSRSPHLGPLRPYLADLRARHGDVPDPDPLDGGADARLLLLLETPGPRIRPTMIVSRDNPSGTGRNLRAMMERAGIARRDTLIWNAVPWIIHAEGARNRAPSRAERQAGIAELPALLALLPRLAVAVLAGRSAAMAESALRAARLPLPVLLMGHPSPTIQCTDPAIPARCAAVLAEAAAILADRPAVGAAA